jgi:hypothetical protein
VVELWRFYPATAIPEDAGFGGKNFCHNSNYLDNDGQR